MGVHYTRQQYSAMQCTKKLLSSFFVHDNQKGWESSSLRSMCLFGKRYFFSIIVLVFALVVLQKIINAVQSFYAYCSLEVHHILIKKKGDAIILLYPECNMNVGAPARSRVVE